MQNKFCFIAPFSEREMVSFHCILKSSCIAMTGPHVNMSPIKNRTVISRSLCWMCVCVLLLDKLWSLTSSLELDTNYRGGVGWVQSWNSRSTKDLNDQTNNRMENETSTEILWLHGLITYVLCLFNIV